MEETYIGNQLNLETSPMKRRRGRPALKKQVSSQIIGESTMYIPMAKKRVRGNSFDTDSESVKEAHKLSQATARKGFTSTAVMKLSSSKKGRKSQLMEINSDNVQDGDKNEIKHASGVKEYISVTGSDYKMLNRTPIQPNQLTSSPMSTLMNSDPAFQPSSPLRTSPLPPAYKKVHANYNHAEPLYNNLQSSPLLPQSRGVSYDENFYKYINSSPVVVNTPARKDFANASSAIQPTLGFTPTQQLNMSRILGLQHINNSNASPIPSSNDENYRLSYSYRLTLDIDDYGKAKIYARVIDHEPMVSKRCYSSTYTVPSTPNHYASQHVYMSNSGDNNEIYYINGKNYEQYLVEQSRLNEFKQQHVKSNLKSDPYMTDYELQPILFDNLNYFNGQTNPNTPQKFQQPNKFNQFVNQEYEKVKTINMNRIEKNPNFNGMSSGIDVDRYIDDYHMNIPGYSKSNNALSAMKKLIFE